MADWTWSELTILQFETSIKDERFNVQLVRMNDVLKQSLDNADSEYMYCVWGRL